MVHSAAQPSGKNCIFIVEKYKNKNKNWNKLEADG